MIEIIKQGEIKWYYKTCPECGTEFRFTKNEPHIDYNYNVNAISKFQPKAIYCPLCRNEISINDIL